MPPVAIHELPSPFSVVRLAFTKSSQRTDPSTFGRSTFNFLDFIGLRTLWHSRHSLCLGHLLWLQCDADTWSKTGGGYKAKAQGSGEQGHSQTLHEGEPSFEFRSSSFLFSLFSFRFSILAFSLFYFRISRSIHFICVHLRFQPIFYFRRRNSLQTLMSIFVPSFARIVGPPPSLTEDS